MVTGARKKAAALGLTVIALVGCSQFNSGASSPDIVLNVSYFEPVDCEDSELCYELRASTDGEGSGQGSCTVVALSDQREELWVEASFDDLELETAAEFEWVVPVEERDDDRFAMWEARCEPQGEG